ncbi:MAG: glycosyltransferase [Candidatus Paceibacterota bacterium]
MRVAIFHDYLNQYGGAERTLEVILEIFPDADIYTLLYDEEKTLSKFKNYNITTSFLNNKFIKNNHRFFIPLMPLASGLMKVKTDYDLIFSSSAGYAKGFGYFNKKVTDIFHICYCHTPLRYAWEIDYLKDLSLAPWLLKRFFVYPIAKILKRWDKKASKYVNVFITNSNFIKRKIRAYYNKDSEVIFPPVNQDIFYPELDKDLRDEGYYLMTGRLLYYKLFNLGVSAFNKLKKPLKIVGSGPEAKALKKLAKDNIEFLPYVTDEELRKLYSNAKAFIFPQVEDFGLVAAEAQMCGTTVIAYRIGGSEDIVEENKTGLFFYNQKSKNLVQAVNKFESMKFNKDYIAKKADVFSQESFKKGIIKVVENSGFKI